MRKPDDFQINIVQLAQFLEFRRFSVISDQDDPAGLADIFLGNANFTQIVFENFSGFVNG